MNDDFGDRMKMYEQADNQRFLPLLPICVRLDGKGFSKFTKDMKRPYDERMSNLMKATTKFLVEETVAKAGYTQSDEISLIYYSDNINSQVFFDGKIQKIISVLSSMCSVFFNYHFDYYFSESFPETMSVVMGDKQISSYCGKMAFFDCRAWVVPTLTEAANVFLWREQDATKNAISMAARCYYSHNALLNKSGSEIQEMLFQKGINFNDYPAFFKRGTFFLRQTNKRPFTTEEIADLPLMHDAHKNPNLIVERQEVIEVDIPKFSSVTNRVGVLFHSEPICVDKGATK